MAQPVTTPNLTDDQQKAVENAKTRPFNLLEQHLLGHSIRSGKAKSTTKVGKVMDATGYDRDAVIDALGTLIMGGYLVIRDSLGNPIKELRDEIKDQITALEFTALRIEALLHLQPVLEETGDDDKKPKRTMKDRITTADGTKYAMVITPEEAGTSGHTGRYELKIQRLDDRNKPLQIALESIHDEYETAWSTYQEWKQEQLKP